MLLMRSATRTAVLLIRAAAALFLLAGVLVALLARLDVLFVRSAASAALLLSRRAVALLLLTGVLVTLLTCLNVLFVAAALILVCHFNAPVDCCAVLRSLPIVGSMEAARYKPNGKTPVGKRCQCLIV